MSKEYFKIIGSVVERPTLLKDDNGFHLSNLKLKYIDGKTEKIYNCILHKSVAKLSSQSYKPKVMVYVEGYFISEDTIDVKKSFFVKEGTKCKKEILVNEPYYFKKQSILTSNINLGKSLK